MITLGIETSSAISDVAVQSGQGLVHKSGDEKFSQSRSLVADCAEAVSLAGITLQELDRIAVGLGPGSFTGIRLGVTAAKSLAWSLGCDVGGVSTFLALAWRAVSALSAEGRLYVVGDARMDELFMGVYSANGEQAAEESLELVHLDELDRYAQAEGVLIGPGLKKFGRHLEQACPGLQQQAGFDAPRAEDVIAAAHQQAVFGKALEHDIEPLYLKSSEPERKLRKKQAKE